jgi:recombination protein RecT
MASNTALTKASQATLDRLKLTLDSKEMKAKILEAIPATIARYLTPERVVKITLMAMNRSPDLLQCTVKSILRSVIESVSLGLEPSGGVLGHAYLVPFNNTKTGEKEAMLIIGYRGMIDLARRSGEIVSVEAHVVHERDFFEIEFGRDPKLVHRPCLTDDPGQVIAGYAVAEFRGGAKHCEFMTRAQIDAIRNRSRAKNSGPWITDYEEMARKTVVRRAAKYWPLSIELTKALDLEDAAEQGITSSSYDDGSPPLPSKPQTQRLAEKLEEQAGDENVWDAMPDEPPHDPDTGEVKPEKNGDGKTREQREMEFRQRAKERAANGSRMREPGED